jgi:ATP-dependent helicase/nuclease subunit B
VTDHSHLPPQKVQIIPYGEDLLQSLAEQIITTHANALPDLTGISILLPAPQAGLRLRRLLLEQAEAHKHTALLGPTITTLSLWVSKQGVSQKPGSNRPVLSEHQRELMLVEALINHKYLYGQGNPWTLADSLLELFDDLNEVHIKLPDQLEAFLDQINAAYGLANQSLNNKSHIDNDSLMGEARLVHTLWQAWHQQMQESDVIDRHTDYLLKLKASQKPLATDYQNGQMIYLAGFTRLSAPECEWINYFMAQGQASLSLQGSEPQLPKVEYHPDNVTQKILDALDINADFPEPFDQYGQCLDTIFSAGHTALQDRATHFAQTNPQSPLASRLKLYEATSAEKEAHAIDLQTRRWWIEGKRNICIVTENRRLARRVRALLERSGIELEDAAGWALSTTSAAASLERWLESVEEDFAYQPFIDLLKSPFLLPEQNRDTLLSSVYRFEQSIVLKENIARGLSRYRDHLHYRQNRLPEELAAEYDDIYSLLDTIATAANPLLPYLDGKQYSPATILASLDESLDTLGFTTAMSQDAAGQRILEELQQMSAATHDSSLQMSWTEFRTWLGRTLERFNFEPPTQSGQVQLMSLGQSSLSNFDGLIIASAEREYLPGSPAYSPFFNDGVRQALGLSSYTEQLSQKFYQFRALLESADNILITRRTEQDSEDVVASPWLERIQSFHRMAYGDDLVDTELRELVNQPDMLITAASDPLPQPIPANPSATIPAAMFPDHISASGYQQLVNCPYQFFAARCLKLEPPETIREMLEKSDYGERVHLCLHAFHTRVAGLPGPFPALLSIHNIKDAIGCLEDIATAVFAQDLEDNFLHRGWLKRWQEMIPDYIHWQLERQDHWRIQTTEANVDAQRPGTQVNLRGRLDRIDTSPEGLGVIDYKTGATPHETDVLEGEAVQLPFYAMLAEQGLNKPVVRVEYVALDCHNKTRSSKRDKPKVEAVGTLEGEEFQALTRAVATRLDNLANDIQTGSPMPAWGDQITCRYCQMSGVCRREAWQK